MTCVGINQACVHLSRPRAATENVANAFCTFSDMGKCLGKKYGALTVWRVAPGGRGCYFLFLYFTYPYSYCFSFILPIPTPCLQSCLMEKIIIGTENKRTINRGKQTEEEKKNREPERSQLYCTITIICIKEGRSVSGDYIIIIIICHAE